MQEQVTCKEFLQVQIEGNRQIFNRTQKIESDFDRSVKELGKQVKALKSSPKKDG